jgi:hypothetical protein
MTSKFKEVTESTPVLFCAAVTGAKAPLSKPSASSDNTPTNTKTSSKPSQLTLITGRSVSEKEIQYALILKVVLSSLMKAKLVKKYRLLSGVKGVVKEYRYVFDPTIWTDELDLVLSSEAK